MLAPRIAAQEPVADTERRVAGPAGALTSAAAWLVLCGLVAPAPHADTRGLADLDAVRADYPDSGRWSGPTALFNVVPKLQSRGFTGFGPSLNYALQSSHDSAGASISALAADLGYDGVTLPDGLTIAQNAQTWFTDRADFPITVAYVNVPEQTNIFAPVDANTINLAGMRPNEFVTYVLEVGFYDCVESVPPCLEADGPLSVGHVTTCERTGTRYVTVVDIREGSGVSTDYDVVFVDPMWESPVDPARQSRFTQHTGEVALHRLFESFPTAEGPCAPDDEVWRLRHYPEFVNGALPPGTRAFVTGYFEIDLPRSIVFVGESLVRRIRALPDGSFAPEPIGGEVQGQPLQVYTEPGVSNRFAVLSLDDINGDGLSDHMLTDHVLDTATGTWQQELIWVGDASPAGPPAVEVHAGAVYIATPTELVVAQRPDSFQPGSSRQITDVLPMTQPVTPLDIAVDPITGEVLVLEDGRIRIFERRPAAGLLPGIVEKEVLDIEDDAAQPSFLGIPGLPAKKTIYERLAFVRGETKQGLRLVIGGTKHDGNGAIGLLKRRVGASGLSVMKVVEKTTLHHQAITRQTGLVATIASQSKDPDAGRPGTDDVKHSIWTYVYCNDIGGIPCSFIWTIDDRSDDGGAGNDWIWANGATIAWPDLGTTGDPTIELSNNTSSGYTALADSAAVTPMNHFKSVAFADIAICIADIDEDGEFNTIDLMTFQQAFLAGMANADFDNSNRLDAFDYAEFLNVAAECTASQ